MMLISEKGEHQLSSRWPHTISVYRIIRFYHINENKKTLLSVLSVYYVSGRSAPTKSMLREVLLHHKLKSRRNDRYVFPTTSGSALPLQLSQSRRSPFFGIGTRLQRTQSLGTHSPLHTDCGKLHIPLSTQTAASYTFPSPHRLRQAHKCIFLKGDRWPSPFRAAYQIHQQPYHAFVNSLIPLSIFIILLCRKIS